MPFTDDAWESPESELDAADFCAVCLVDENPGGQPKIKGKCKLPVRSTPGGPYNTNAIRNAMGRIFQMTGVAPAAKKAAARKLVSLAREADIEVGDSVLILAGQRTGR